MSSDQSILVTGAGGMLGRALLGVLRDAGHDPIGLARADLDIADERALRAVFERHRPTLVLNAAAHTKVDLCEDEPHRCDAINGHAVGHLARLAREYGSTLVHYSTDFVFDGRLRRPYRVDDPVNPISAYGRSKLLGEQMLQANAPARWLIIRTAWVYGPSGMNFPRAMVERARAGHPLQVVEDEVGSPTYTVDLARATMDLLEAGAQGLVNVANSGSVSRFAFARAVLDEFGVSAELTPITSARWLELRPKQARRPAYSVLDLASFTRLVGRPMRPWAAALHDFRLAIDARGGF